MARPPRTSAPAFASPLAIALALALALGGCESGVTQVILDLRTEAGVPTGDIVTLELDFGAGLLRSVPITDELDDGEHAISIIPPESVGGFGVMVTALGSEGTVIATGGTGGVTVVIGELVRQEILLTCPGGCTPGTDSGPESGGDAGTDSGSDGGGADSGGGPVTTHICPGGLTLLVVTTAVDELDDPGSPMTVNDVGGAGDVSLREAIVLANNNGGFREIRFDSGAFPMVAAPTLVVGSGPAGAIPLPGISSPGNCVDGDGANVVISGTPLSGGEHGLVITSSANTVGHLSVVGFPGDGIRIEGGSAMLNQITECGVGVFGNYFSATPTALGNGGDGIAVVNADGNSIGPFNVVGANVDVGIVLNSGSSSNLVIENYVGIDAVLTGAFPNSEGIVVDLNSNNNLIGGSTTNANRVGNNTFSGISIQGGSTGNTVSYNYIGGEPGGTSFGNGGHGIAVAAGAADTTVEANYIWDNSVHGIILSDGTTTGVVLTANLITANSQNAITLSGGANFGIVAPTITSAMTGGGMIMVTGTAATGDGSIVEVFRDPVDEAGCFIGGGVVVTGGAWTYIGPDMTGCGTNVTSTVTESGSGTSSLSGPFAAP